jgi:opacity protein-like surface antigen
MMTMRNKLMLSAAVAAAALGSAAAFADSSVLKAGDIATAQHWYGRAGGLVGSERIGALRTNGSNPGIGVTYDRDVAARTNMSTDRAPGQSVTVTYDQEVAERTNMARSRETAPVHSAGAPAATTN